MSVVSRMWLPIFLMSNGLGVVNVLMVLPVPVALSVLARQNLFRVPPDPRPVTVLVSSPVLNMQMDAPILRMVSLSSPVLPRLMTCSMPFPSLWTT